MVKVLVACADYPHGDVHPMQYVHVRNLYYLENEIEVEVLNFSANNNYIYEGINVISYNYFKANSSEYSNYVLVCHAPNIRNHFLFLKKYQNIFRRVIFIFHGHEIVKLNDVYSKPYDFKRKSIIKNKFQDLYDAFKLYIWRKYFKKNHDSIMIFVSNSLYMDFFRYIKIKREELLNDIYIINNAVGKVFEQNKYNNSIDKEYDFITIRSNLDNSIYCIDLINEFAKKNSDCNFLLIGKGEYFNHNNKARNITWIDRQMNQEELMHYIDISKYALMPTRRDSQGLMTCELATYGINVITSDLDVCYEMFDGFNNVKLLSESEILELDINEVNFSCNNYNEKFYSINTMEMEVKIIRGVVSE